MTCTCSTESDRPPHSDLQHTCICSTPSNVCRALHLFVAHTVHTAHSANMGQVQQPFSWSRYFCPLVAVLYLTYPLLSLHKLLAFAITALVPSHLATALTNPWFQKRNASSKSARSVGTMALVSCIDHITVETYCNKVCWATKQGLIRGYSQKHLVTP